MLRRAGFVFWKASGMWFPVEMPGGGSLNKTQQTEVLSEITVSTGSILLFPRFMPRYRTLQSLWSSKAAWGCMKNLAAVRSQITTWLMPGHRPFISQACIERQADVKLEFILFWMTIQASLKALDVFWVDELFWMTDLEDEDPDLLTDCCDVRVLEFWI